MSQDLVLSSPQLTKTQFVESVKKWVILDTELKKTNDRAKKIRDMKSTLHSSICDYMKSNQMYNKKIEISDGELRLCEKKEYSPLTYHYIETCLADVITDKEQLEFLIQYLKSHREVKTTTELRRTHVPAT